MKGIISLLKKTYHDLTKEKPLRFYSIDGFLLDMGEGHQLSLTQKYHPMYDRFVPYLGKLVENVMVSQSSRGVILDIGANVGDTCAGMIKHTSADYICVEPTTKFFNLLKDNIKKFGPAYSNRITLVKAYISQNMDEHFNSKVINGTAIKALVEDTSNSEAPTYSITNLYKHLSVNPKDVVLIKIDTDGYDSECILSLEDTLKYSSPLIFWENQIDNESQYNKFIQMLDFLKDNCYDTFFVFDNFGNYLCLTDIDGIKDINTYLLRILKDKSTRSFYYVDVLSCKSDKKEQCVNIVKQYSQDYL